MVILSGRKQAWKRAGEGLSDRLIEGTVKFGGGSVMLYGCMLWDRPGYAYRIDGRMHGDLLIVKKTIILIYIIEKDTDALVDL